MSLTRLLPALLVFPLAVSAGCFAEAQPGEAHAMRKGFTYLGERFVNGRADHDVIGVGRADGRFHSIMVVVENAPVEMYDVVVTLGDGEVYREPTRLVFGPDQTSRVIDLPGGGRVIRRVDFHYGNIPGQGQAKVELWGR
jgi:hypothetical protein